MRAKLKGKPRQILDSAQRKAIQAALRKLPRYNLVWEQMNESSSGTYIRLEDAVWLTAKMSKQIDKNIVIPQNKCKRETA